MDRADYYEAKAALQNLKVVQLENELRARVAQTTVDRILARLQVPPASSYQWDDAALTITPTGGHHGG